MIIKSMSRKEPTFAQLVDYVESGRADDKYTVRHNLYSRTPDSVKTEFEENAAYLRRRKGGNFMYHEVISITRSEQLELDEQKARLREIVRDYIQERARHNLVYAAMHDDKEDNLHYHLIISANEIQESKRFRLTKSRFDQIKKSLEIRVLESYPELEQKKIINQEAGEKLSNKGAERKRRTGKTPQRDKVKAKVKAIFEQATTKEELLSAFEKAGLDFYIRGKSPGVIDRESGRKHRLKTLGFIEAFNRLDEKITQDAKQASKQRKRKTPPAKPKEQPMAKESDNQDAEIKPESKTKETLKEWVLGDFSARDARIKQAEYERIQKLIKEGHSKLDATDIAREWMLGDFSAREERATAERIKAYYERLDREKAQAKEKADNQSDEATSKQDIIKARKAEIEADREARKQSSQSDSDSDKGMKR